MSIAFLDRKGKPSLAYDYQPGNRSGLPTLVFLHGFRSDMMGTKAQFLSDHCSQSGQSFLRFDYSGHGHSEGVFTEGTIGGWLDDALDMVAAKTDGKILIVGSSMGGWIGLHVALHNQSRLAGFIGLAAAPDFTRWIRNKLSPGQREEIERAGFVKIQNDYAEPYHITKRFLDEAENQCLMDGPIPLLCPIRLVQGMKDDDVPWETAQKIADSTTGQDKKVYLLEQSDHRLSAPGDLILLAQLVDELTG